MSVKTPCQENSKTGILGTSQKIVYSRYRGMPRVGIADNKMNMTPEEKNDQLASMLTGIDFRTLYITAITREENIEQGKGRWVVFFI